MEKKKDSTLRRRFLNLLPVCGKSCHRRIIYVLWAFLFLLPIQQYYSFQFEFTRWDLLLFTGVMTFILGLNLTANLHRRFRLTLNRLILRGVIKVSPEQKRLLFEHLEQYAQDCARIGGLVVSIMILGAFAVVLLHAFFWQRALLGIAEGVGGYIAGTYLGRMVSYGLLGRQLEKKSIEIKTQPSHVDGVAGLKPIGDFFFYQATILAIPALFLGVWWLLFPIWPRDYSSWQNAYLVLLSGAICIEILGFLVPIWFFHRVMVDEKIEWLKKADKLSSGLYEVQPTSDADRPWETKKMSHEQVEMMRKYYWSIENMTTWPVDIATRGRFRLHNVLLFIPLLGDIVKRSFDWKHILSLLKQLG